MKHIFRVGDKKVFVRTVRSEDTATFEGSTIHPVYGTFALARDAEWSSRLFVLDMKEDDEEGIGTFVEVQHRSPAFIGDIVTFETVIDELNGHNVNCSFTASANGRQIATGRTGQKILTKEKLAQIFSALRENNPEEQVK